MKQVLVAWDFDGTLVNTLPLLQETFDEELYGEPVTAGRLSEVRSQGWQTLLPKLTLLRKARNYLKLKTKMSQQDTALLVIGSDLVHLIANLAAQGYVQAIVSASAAEQIRQVIARHGLTSAIQEIKGNQAPFGKHFALQKLAQNYPLITERYYVGDEVRDIMAARRAKYTPLSVSWGYQRKELLRKNNHLVAGNVSELAKLIS